MTLEIRPLGVKCNIQCHYCYQDPLREVAGNHQKYDLQKIKAAIIKNDQNFLLFGGEPLLIPKQDLEDLFKFGCERYGSNAIQTNGSLIDDEHIELFKRYKVAIGISLDGPGVLNKLRWAGSETLTDVATEKSCLAIERLIFAGLVPGLIVTLHRSNASPAALPRLLDWFGSLDKMGLKSARLHLLEVDSKHVRDLYALSPRENAQALEKIRIFEKGLKRLRFDLFSEVRALLRGADRGASCTWRSCDPYTTESVHGIEGMGQTSNCGRTNKAGVDFVKASESGFERYVALYQTPFEAGGCQGCRYFIFCRGQCPGEAIDGDWRNRSENCEAWYSLFRTIEAEMLVAGEIPVSTRDDRVDLERRLIELLSEGGNCSVARLVEERQLRPQNEQR